MPATDLARTTAELASYDVGLRETGQNEGPRIREYLACVGLLPPCPYCAAACSCWVLEAAFDLGVKPKFKRSGSALGLLRNNPELLITALTPDDLPCIGVLKSKDGIHSHAFIVVGMDDAERLQTIEPNSNGHGSREGGGVYALGIRKVQDCAGFIRIE